MQPLRDRWQRLWQALGASDTGDALFEDLVSRYQEPQRHYHTLEHLSHCLAQLDALRACAADPALAELALWFHDAVYDPARDDNEPASAALARTEALATGLAAATAGRLHALVLATRHESTPADRDEAVVVDADLAILGAPPARFDRYQRQVREEYAWVPEPVYRNTRRALLLRLLQRPALFHTPAFVERYEARARANLERAIAALAA